MAAVKNLLKHVTTEVAGRRRKCSRKSTHVIVKGETCLVVRDGPQSQTTYCVICASEILLRVDEKLESLKQVFDRCP